MFRNSIKEMGEPSLDGLEAASLPRRDSLSRLHDALKSASVDGCVRCHIIFLRIEMMTNQSWDRSYGFIFFSFF